MAWRALSHVSKVHIINSLAAVKHGGEKRKPCQWWLYSMSIRRIDRWATEINQDLPGPVGWLIVYTVNQI